MTTTSEKLIVDSWDYYLDDDSPAREHVEMFREVEWVYMQKELRHDLDYELGVGQEPHWVEPGRAILYHNVSVSEYGRETNYGWKATNPLPIGNAIQLRNYLQKGFRLRANVDALVNVELSETADSAEGDPYEDTPYVIPTAKGQRKFINWDAYRNYCMHRGIAPTLEPPKEILDKMAKSEYYCLLHDHVFKSERAAKQHYSYYVARPPRGRGMRHATVEQMKVVKPKPKKTTTKSE
jgi:hypothetical protein